MAQPPSHCCTEHSAEIDACHPHGETASMQQADPQRLVVPWTTCRSPCVAGEVVSSCHRQVAVVAVVPTPPPPPPS